MDREQDRIPGLLAAVAARSRKRGDPFDEPATRAALDAGRMTVDDLQRRADELAQPPATAAPHPERSGGRVRNAAPAPDPRRRAEQIREALTNYPNLIPAERAKLRRELAELEGTGSAR